MKKNVSKIRLAVFLLAVMAMVLGASVTVSASYRAVVDKGGYLRKEPYKASPTVTYLEAGTIVTAGYSEGSYIRVICGDESGWFLRKYISPAEGGDYRTTVQECALRTGASYSKRFIMNVPAGSLVKVIDNVNGWYKVTYKKRTGYIPPEALDGGKNIRYTKKDGYRTAFRRTPYKDEQNRNLIQYIPQGKAVTVIKSSVKTDLEWAYVSYNGTNGYVAVSRLQ
jgi:uncharacterized protein YgiM (DUF1202 family)